MSYQKKRLVSVVWIISLVHYVNSQGQVEEESLTSYYRDFRMPGVLTTKPEQYICTAMALNSSIEEWLLAFEPEVTIETAHHMTLYGCADVPRTTGVWDCAHLGVCHRPRHISMWSSNAPGTALPSGVGFRVGGDSDVQYLTLQIHYAHPNLDVEDRSGLKIRVTTNRQPFVAGVLILTANRKTTLPPNTERAYMDAACQLKSMKVLWDIHIIGYRVHTHKHGTVVKGYRYDVKTGEYELIIAGNPQWPQAMYPREELMTLTPEDVVAVRCTYNTTGIGTIIHVGRNSMSEMCTVDLLYYTEYEHTTSDWVECGGVHESDVIKNLPEGNDVALPPNPLLIAEAKGFGNTDKSEVITYLPVVAHSPASRRIEDDSSKDQK